MSFDIRDPGFVLFVLIFFFYLSTSQIFEFEKQSRCKGLELSQFCFCFICLTLFD